MASLTRCSCFSQVSSPRATPPTSSVIFACRRFSAMFISLLKPLNQRYASFTLLVMSRITCAAPRIALLPRFLHKTMAGNLKATESQTCNSWQRAKSAIGYRVRWSGYRLRGGNPGGWARFYYFHFSSLLCGFLGS